MCCSFWEKCKNSPKTALGCSIPLTIHDVGVTCQLRPELRTETFIKNKPPLVKSVWRPKSIDISCETTASSKDYCGTREKTLSLNPKSKLSKLVVYIQIRQLDKVWKGKGLINFQIITRSVDFHILR